jgi:hypothetical protein
MVVVVICSQDTDKLNYGGRGHQDMEYLMAAAINIESAWPQTLRESRLHSNQRWLRNMRSSMEGGGGGT